MIKREDVFKEVISPQEYDELLKNTDNLSEVLSKLYKLNYMNLRLTLDTRFNLVQLSKGKKIMFKSRNENIKENEPENPVIKTEDKIDIGDK